jgi:hypothetical protein
MPLVRFSGRLTELEKVVLFSFSQTNTSAEILVHQWVLIKL